MQIVNSLGLSIGVKLNSEFQATAHDDAHCAFMTLPPYTRTREGEVPHVAPRFIVGAPNPGWWAFELGNALTEHLRLLETHRSLLYFKQKFHPCWESRYVVASTTLALPKIALAVLRVHQS